MPELPEVETVVRGLKPILVGRTIEQIKLASQQMIDKQDAKLLKRLVGATCTELRRHGKFMFACFSNDHVMLMHLGMTGWITIPRHDEPILKHTHLRIVLDQRDELRFVDPRRFGEIRMLNQTQLVSWPTDRHMGPDALALPEGHLANVLSKSSARIKSALLNQRVLAGVGNIYADEVLFSAGVHPGKRGHAIGKRRLNLIQELLPGILLRAIDSHGTTIRNYRDANGASGEFQNQLAVYGRAGEPCIVCRTPLKHSTTIMPGRSTVYCSVCQK